MAARRNRQWLISRRFNGSLTADNFRWAESEVPEVQDGQFLVRNLWLSFDPTQIYMLGREDSTDPDGGGLALGTAMGTIAISKVIESRHPEFKPGDLVHGHVHWEDYTVTDGQGFTPTYRVAEGVPAQWAVGPLGLTGLVAYFGVHEVARPRAGELFVVSGAAGGVGSIAIQLAKLEGLRSIGIAGGPAKCDWLRQEVAPHAVIDHRTEDVAKRLDELAPDGIDIYFDNAGGPILDAALERLRPGGRIVLCGATSRYTEKAPPPGPRNYLALVMVNGRMEGLLGRDYLPRRQEALDAMLPMLRTGRLKSKEDVLEGLREAPRGLERLFAGENVGKQLLRMDTPGSP